MNLDDRLRSAQQKQVRAINTHLRSEGLDRAPTAADGGPIGSGRRWMLLAATGAVAAVVAVFAVPLLAPEPDTVSTIDDVSTSTSVETTTSTPTESTTTTTETTTAAPTTAATADTATAEDTTTTATDTSTVPTTSTAPTTATSTPATSTSSTTAVALAEPKPTTVCPSGFRAPLEMAGVLYLSEDIGWNRKDDLIDEQDSQYYYEAWEPNYPGIVQVEVVMPKPVMATELRVAQDTASEVSGVIDAEAAGQAIKFQLEGLGGWQVHAFDEPTLLDRFTLTRSGTDANIVEVMVCVDRP